jgi:hypothetical protein
MGRESLDLYLDEISQVPLTRDEVELARKAFRGNIAARRWPGNNVRFVVSVAKKFRIAACRWRPDRRGNWLMTAARKLTGSRRQVHLLRGLVDSPVVGRHRAAWASGAGATQPYRRSLAAGPDHDAPRAPGPDTDPEGWPGHGLTVEAVRSLSALNSEAVRSTTRLAMVTATSGSSGSPPIRKGPTASRSPTVRPRTSRRPWRCCRRETLSSSCIPVSKTGTAGRSKRSAG